MPDDFEQRLASALRAEVADLSFALTEQMVEERMRRATAVPWGPVLASSAGALLLVAGIGLGLTRGLFGFGHMASPSTPGSPITCPVTQPNGVEPPPGEMPSGLYYGNAQLITGLDPAGVINAKPMDMQGDGSAGIKWGWWRGTGVKAAITADGHRLDQTGPPLRIDIPAGYGLSGFQVAGLYFPTPGCWEVTARAGAAKLTFVTLVNFPVVTVNLPAGTFQADVPVNQCIALVVSDSANTTVLARWWDPGASGDCTTTTSSIVSGTARLVGGNVMAIDIPLIPSGVQTLHFAIARVAPTEIITEATGFGTARVAVRFRRVDTIAPSFAPVS